jgi:anti-sigma B factor antagonist
MLIQDDTQTGPVDFSAEIIECEGSILVKLSGELDISTAGTLREILVEQVHLPGITALGLDLSGLSFLDSSGISVLVVACKRVRASGGSFSIRCDHTSVHRVLEIQSLINFFKVDTSADGIRELGT